MAGLFLLLALTAFMTLASFMAGALPLSMGLSQSQLRLIASIGAGILVGTSLIVIIPEGVESITAASIPIAPAPAILHAHDKRSHPEQLVQDHIAPVIRHVDEHANAALPRQVGNPTPTMHRRTPCAVGISIGASVGASARRQIATCNDDQDSGRGSSTGSGSHSTPSSFSDYSANGDNGYSHKADGSYDGSRHGDDDSGVSAHFQSLPGPSWMSWKRGSDKASAPQNAKRAVESDEHTSGGSGGKGHPELRVPTFYIGLSLILGFILMYLIDRIPQIASDNLQGPSAPRQISLSNLGASAVEDESEGFLGGLAPTPKHSKSLATTTGLVIHAAADGIALGASTASQDAKLGLIVFVALMMHKAPAAFGLTSLLLKQGLSKRAARGHLIVFSLASPLGAWATYILVSLLRSAGDDQWHQWWTGMLLLFSAGTFLYVAMHALTEGESASSEAASEGHSVTSRKHSHPQMRETLGTVVGMLLPLLTQLGHHSH